MSFSTLPTSFWRYSLETKRFHFNLISSKLVPLTPMEIWTRRKLGLHHVHIWGYPIDVLKQKVEMLELRLEVYQFVRYPKGTRVYYFYNRVN